MSDEHSASKDAFFQQIAELSDAMIAAHGRDFAIGTLVLAARFVAEGEARAAAGRKVPAEAAATPPGQPQ